MELLSATTEKLCGYKVGSAQIEQYLKKHLDKWLIEDDLGTGATPPVKPIKAEIIEEGAEKEKEEATPQDAVDIKVEMRKSFQNYEGKVIKSFTFNRHTYKVDHWEDMLTTVCNQLAALHEEDFERVLWISGKDKTFFSKYQDQLNIPEEINETEIYVETKLTPNEVVKTLKTLLAEFGYSWDEFTIAAE